MKLVKKAVKGARDLWELLWGLLFTLLFYDRRCLRSRWFHGLGADGWHWACRAGFARLFTGAHRGVRFPANPQCRIEGPENLRFEPEDLNNFQSYGVYWQAFAPISLGRGCFVAPNVGLITANHDPADPTRHLAPQPITLGEKCWIGMNSVILPGVTLGPHTVVGAGSVVTRSFPEGCCVLAGSPARVIKTLASQETVGKDG